jgi:hypothetical protein
MNNLHIRFNIILINPVIRLIVNLIVYTVIYILLCPNVVVYAMEQDRDTVKGIFDAIRDGNEQSLSIVLERIRTITDPARIARINAIINELSIQYGIPMDLIHGNDKLTIANSGLPPEEESIDWRNVLINAAIFVGASAIVYLIWRNFHHVTDFFSDVVQRGIENIDYTGLFHRIGVIFRHSPTARNALLNHPEIRALINEAVAQLPNSGGPGASAS